MQMSTRTQLRIAATLGAAAVLAGLIASGVASGRADAPGTCSRAAALEAMTRYRLISDPQLRSPVGQLLCGAFAGPGTNAMAASSAHGACLPFSGWGVFRYTAGAWKIVPGGYHPGILSPGIARAGNDIVEKRTVRYFGESVCRASGLKIRVWHWNASRLAAGAWKLTSGQDQFLSADRGIWCVLANHSTTPVYCGNESPVHSVTLRANGKVTICNGVGCVQNWNEHARVLQYGRRVDLNGFRCTSEPAGITCIVTAAGAARGKGFLINATGVTRVP